MKIWVIGAYGIVSTTAMVGAKAIAKEIAPRTGLVSELPPFRGIDKYAPLEFEFGGHEVRMLKNAFEAAEEHWELNRHFERDLLDAVKEDLEKIVANKGTALNCGTGIQGLGKIETLEDDGLTLKEIVNRITEDIKRFADDETVVINLASTEPLPNLSEEYHGTLEGFERMIDENKKEYASASMLYAYAALKLGLPYANFTPSPGSAIPALKELAEKMGVPHAGNDGKTGETLVKTTLAPMFAYRNMEVVGWMSYNILGDYDGKVLSARDNKESKVLSKDKVLEKMLGYSPYSITEIQYFPSLVDNKTAFDFIHFKGFLGRLMKFYFIWDAIDAIVAAPLILDIARFLLFAKKKGVKGVVKEMAFFFKSPMDTNVINTHEQFEVLKKWYSKLS
ncbi:MULTISPECIES: inositol-3-phosphate synthase [unclassified Archaeoglobus]|jgi:myo-inositol-1-phosphate synthase|uniref:inositol-3-phosphate synthase n=1 Tax=unclassified Archaeoglobus TaxID=2643606 RepID=UPI0025B845A2|nr:MULTISPECIES: inositol-3-phosphate synthase [unclassified Archaeoglobus]